MTVNDLINQVRYAVNDTDKIEYTDEELINYINQAQDYISNVCINNSFQGLIKKQDLTLTDGKATLPSDLVREFSVVAGKYILNSVPPDADVDEYSYKIIGNEIYSKNDTLTIYYFYMYPSYTTISDIITVPNVFLNILREIVIFLARNRVELPSLVERDLSNIYEGSILSVINAYGNSNLKRPMPF